MIRRLFNFASAISLLLCAAVVVLWIRSYWRGDFLSKTAPGQSTDFGSQRGKVLFYHQINAPIFPIDSQSAQAQWSYSSSQAPGALDTGDETWLNRIGVYAEWRTPSPSSAMPFSQKPQFDTITQIIFPHWMVAIPLAVLPGFWLIFDIRRRARAARLVQGQCVQCGYDLCASKGEFGPHRRRPPMIRPPLALGLAVAFMAFQNGCVSPSSHEAPSASGAVLTLEECTRLADAEADRAIDAFNAMPDAPALQAAATPPGPFRLSEYRRRFEAHQREFHGRPTFFFHYELTRPVGFSDGPAHFVVWVFQDTGQAGWRGDE